MVRKVLRPAPEKAGVVLLGDGEFDGVDLQTLVDEYEWKCVLRTGKTTTLSREGQEFSFNDVASHLTPGDVFDVPGAPFTQRGYGPVLAIARWRRDCKEPIQVVSIVVSWDEALNCVW